MPWDTGIESTGTALLLHGRGAGEVYEDKVRKFRTVTARAGGGRFWGSGAVRTDGSGCRCSAGWGAEGSRTCPSLFMTGPKGAVRGNHDDLGMHASCTWPGTCCVTRVGTTTVGS